MKRIPFSKKIRFEVFKRDNFTCQYCGEKAPNVVLQVDHIEPVSKGGNNNITNLITSCFGCNNGKRDKKLSDDSVVEKERKQLELLQERREQIELMFKWKESLNKIDEETLDKVVKHTEAKITPYTLSELGRKDIEKHVKTYSLDNILDAVDISARNYLQFTAEGVLEKGSVENFLNKIGGILYNKNLCSLKKKVAHLKSIIKKRFGKDDVVTVFILINKYINALKRKGYSDDQVAKDIENELIPKTEEFSWWSEFRDLVEKWTNDINNWKEDSQEAPSLKEFSQGEICSFTDFELAEIKGYINAINQIGKAFPCYNDIAFSKKLSKNLLEFLLSIEKIEENQVNSYKNKDVSCDLISKFSLHEDLKEYFNYDAEDKSFLTLSRLESVVDSMLYEMFESMFYPIQRYTYKNSTELIKLMKEKLQELEN